MKIPEEIRYTVEDYTVSAKLYAEALTDVLPKLIFTLIAIKTIADKRPLDELAASLRMFDFIDLEDLERKGKDLETLAVDFNKSAQSFGELILERGSSLWERD